MSMSGSIPAAAPADPHAPVIPVLTGFWSPPVSAPVLVALAFDTPAPPTVGHVALHGQPPVDSPKFVHPANVLAASQKEIVPLNALCITA